MSKKITVTLLPGDGIGPEIVGSMRRIFTAMNIPIEWEEVSLQFKESDKGLSKEILDSLNRTKVGIKGPTTTPVGKGHRSLNVTLRQEFNLYANVRPLKSIKGIDCIYESLDFIIVRENTEDLYKGIEFLIDEETACGIKTISKRASQRIGRFALKLAQQQNRKRVTIVHKANIMKLTDGLFLRSILELGHEYPEIHLHDMIVDNCSMQLVRNPKQFEVIVTENLYGDIISDLASGLVGGLGVAAGANIGDDIAVFEPVHGSAPDIAGKGLANPTAMLFSAMMMLDHVQFTNEAQKLKESIEKCLANPETRTKDLGGSCNIMEFTNAIIEQLNQ